MYVSVSNCISVNNLSTHGIGRAGKYPVHESSFQLQIPEDQEQLSQSPGTLAPIINASTDNYF